MVQMYAKCIPPGTTVHDFLQPNSLIVGLKHLGKSDGGSVDGNICPAHFPGKHLQRGYQGNQSLESLLSTTRTEMGDEQID